MRKVLSLAAIACLSTACGGGSGNNKSGNIPAPGAGAPPSSTPRFFNKSWIEPGNDWWLRTHQRLWPSRMTSWADYFISRDEIQTASIGASGSCDVSGKWTLLEKLDGTDSYYRVEFQQCMMDINDSSTERALADGIASRKINNTTIDVGDQTQKLYGFENLSLSLPSLAKEHDTITYLVNAPTPFEDSNIIYSDGRSGYVKQGNMSITRGGETFQMKLQNSRGFSSYSPPCTAAEYSIDEMTIQSDMTGTLRYSYNEQRLAGEEIPFNQCYFPGYQFNKTNSPIKRHPDYIPSIGEKLPTDEHKTLNPDSTSQFDFSHSDGSRMRLLYKDLKVTYQIDENGDGDYEIEKVFDEEDYYIEMRGYSNVERIPKPD